MSARENLIGYALVALPNEPAFAKCEEMADAFRAEVIAERDAQIVTWLTKKAREYGDSNRENRAKAEAVACMASKLSRGAVRENNMQMLPRTERSYWVAIADALNAAESAGMAISIDLDGTLTDHTTWSVVWDRKAEKWAVAGYDEEARS